MWEDAVRKSGQEVTVPKSIFLVQWVAKIYARTSNRDKGRGFGEDATKIDCQLGWTTDSSL